MIWRTTAIALTLNAAVSAGETQWSYVKLVDTPLAPSERSTPGRILKVCAVLGPAADGEPPALVIENAICVVPELAGDVHSKTPAGHWRVFVGGEVHRIGAFTGNRPYTALQAVVAAGGLKEGGADDEVVVLRYGEKNAPPKATRVDLSKSLAGRGTVDLWLETHDVVIVPKAGKSTEEVIQSVPPAIAAAAKSRTIPAPPLKPVSKQTKK